MGGDAGTHDDDEACMLSPRGPWRWLLLDDHIKLRVENAMESAKAVTGREERVQANKEQGEGNVTEKRTVGLDGESQRVQRQRGREGERGRGRESV